MEVLIEVLRIVGFVLLLHSPMILYAYECWRDRRQESKRSADMWRCRAPYIDFSRAHQEYRGE